MSTNNNFAVIDIGSNDVKCVCFVNGSTVDIEQDNALRNKRLTQKDGENLDPLELLRHIQDYINVAQEKGIAPSKVYIVATEAFRKSSNKDKIIKLIKERIGRNIHIISPKREAYLSALGGLSYIRNNFRSKPNKILYIESGGGSTEVSLFDTSKTSFLSMIETFSIPLGSKSTVQESDLIKYDNSFEKMLSLVDVSDKVAVVVNSSAAGRVIAHQNRLQKYIPPAVAKKQLGMQTDEFLVKLDEIIPMNVEDIKKDFYLIKGDHKGFLSHCKILQYVLKKCKPLGKVPLTTTVGGLKLGLEKEIKRAKGDEVKIARILEKENITIGADVTSVKDEEQTNIWHIRVKRAVANVNAEANGSFCFQDVDTKGKDGPLTFVDKNNKDNKIQFASMSNASVCGDIQAYYAICMTAKKLRKNISFGNFKTLEQRALLYQACLEREVDVDNPPNIDDFKDCKNFELIKKLARKPETMKPIIVNEKSVILKER